MPLKFGLNLEPELVCDLRIELTPVVNDHNHSSISRQSLTDVGKHFFD